MLQPTYFLAATALIGSLLLFTRSMNNDDLVNFRQLSSSSITEYNDPKTVAPRQMTLREQQQQQPQPNFEFEFDITESLIENRPNCQVVYIMGVEGTAHHGLVPVLETLAKHQIDPATQFEYIVDVDPKPLKSGLFGWHRNLQRKWGFKGGDTPPMDHPDLVRSVVQSSCPLDGKKHVMIEWQSFPSGLEEDRRKYRVLRQREWLSMTPREIAADEEALRHPANMTAFVEAYSPYAEIRFVVLNRPFLETIASNPDWDESLIGHSNIIRGFLLILRNFLDVHHIDGVDGRRLWSMVCVERIMAKFYEREEDVIAARANIIAYLANFLGWPVGECPYCFDQWHDSTKDPMEMLGALDPKTVDTLFEHLGTLEGVWPPPGESGVEEQQCMV